MSLPAETSTPGFFIEARNLIKAVFAVGENSIEEAAAVDRFFKAVEIERNAFLNSAMDAADLFCGNARGYPGQKKRPHLLEKGVERLLDLGRLRLDAAQHFGIVDGKREIEETCGHLRNILLHYVGKDSDNSREASEISGKLLGLWLEQAPMQAAEYFMQNFRYNSREALQAEMADRVCLVVERHQSHPNRAFDGERLPSATEPFATELTRPVLPSLGLS